MGPIPELEMDMKVAELFKDQTKEWDAYKIENHFPLLSDTINTIKPSKWGGEDKRIWLKQTSGSYSAKSGYYAAMEIKYPDIIAQPPKLRLEQGGVECQNVS